MKGARNRKRSADRVVWVVLLVLFSTLFVVSASVLVYQGAQQVQSDIDRDHAMNVAGLPDPNDFLVLPADTSQNGGNGNAGDGNGQSGDGNENVPGAVDNVNRPTPPLSSGSDYDPSSGSAVPGPYAEAIRGSISIKNLKSYNSDVIGWIYIGGSRSGTVNVSEPIIYYKDNDYYLRRTWLKNKANDGCIFMEHMCEPDFSGFNTIIYGHRLRSEKMFGKLGDFAKKANWEKDPFIYIYTEDRMLMYKIYSVYRVPVSGMTYQVGFGGDSSKQEFINYTLKQAMYDTSTIPTVNDRILTLSTCTGDTGNDKYAERFIVQAMLVSETVREDK